MKRKITNKKLIHKQIKFFILTVTVLVLAGISLVPPKIMAQTENSQSEIKKSATKIRTLKEKIERQKKKIKKLQDTLVEQEMEIGELQKGNVERPIHPTVERLRASLELVREKNRKLKNYRKITEETEHELIKVKKFQAEGEGQKLTVTLDEAILFPAGKAELKTSISSTFQKFIEIAQSYPDFKIFVEGHTDNLPMKAESKFESNWELSVMRAVSVVKYIEKNSNIASERLIAAGHGPHQPVVPNDSAENRKLNRRVEISLIPPALMED